MPVLGSNCVYYDLNLIKEHFAELLADTTGNVQVGRSNMFMKTNGFHFVDILNYLSPGISYEKWAKAYGCLVQKSWFHYEWFNSPEKLNYPGLLDYLAWYSRLKDEYSTAQRYVTTISRDASYFSRDSSREKRDESHFSQVHWKYRYFAFIDIQTCFVYHRTDLCSRLDFHSHQPCVCTMCVL